MNVSRFLFGIGSCTLLVSPLFAGQREDVNQVALYLQETKQPTISREGFDIVSTYTQEIGQLTQGEVTYGTVLVRFKQYNSGAQHVDVVGTRYNEDYSFTTYRVLDGEPERFFDGHVDYASRKRTHIRDIARKFGIGKLLIDPPHVVEFNLEREFGLPPILDRLGNFDIGENIVKTVEDYYVSLEDEVHDTDTTITLHDRDFFREGIALAKEIIEREQTTNHE